MVLLPGGGRAPSFLSAKLLPSLLVLSPRDKGLGSSPLFSGWRETNTPWREAHRYALAQLYLFLFLPWQVLRAARRATTPQLGLAAGAGRWLCCFFHFCHQMWRVPRAPCLLSVKLLHGLAEVISVKVGQDGEPREEGEAEGGERLDVGHRWTQ